ncbi:hypothetical protein SDC9_96441 [bioreactor metagenome]|uniref:Uncharacterized protein n=1 Tax=bioreactor metagenome TaxID=1076179 RepID=A0A645ABR8_9ZZZZ|nr:hypothetical protein [Lutispora sp.]MEA4964074.1 hypothetical protein [Lutispora sp.]
MRKMLALLLAVLAIMAAQTSVALACYWGLLEEVETPEFLIK